jgi:hypothetical protein
MKQTLLSLNYCYSYKKVSNICKYLFKDKPTIKTAIERMKVIFSDEQKQAVPIFKYRKGESHVPRRKFKIPGKESICNLPGGFYPSKLKNRVWERTFNHYLNLNPTIGDTSRVVRYYYHYTKANAGIKMLRVSRKNILANKFKKRITVYFEINHD